MCCAKICTLTGTKEGCGEGECGSCSVRMNGELVNSCLVPVLQAEGAEIQTVEGLASNGKLHPVQQAFLDCGGAQCGICTPGMLMAAVQLIERNPHPSMAEIREGLAGNLCRCTGFMRIFESVLAAATSAAESVQGRSIMRGNPDAHELIAPGTLPAVLDLLASAPGEWTPIAGGTELMVAFAAGRLGARKLVNLWGIPDLRFIKATPESFVIGACTTFLDLRAHAGLAAELPLIAKVLRLDWFYCQPEPRDAWRQSHERFACR
jgi:carbon-monoxide dehydrogenase small subunit